MKTLFNILVISTAFLCFAQRIKTEEVMQKRLVGSSISFPPERYFFAFIEIYSDEASITAKTDAISRTCVGALALPDLVITAASCFEPFEDITRVIVLLTDPEEMAVQSSKAKHVVYWQNEMACVECDSYPPFQPNLAQVMLETPFAAVNALKYCDEHFWEKPLLGREVSIANHIEGVAHDIEMEVTETEGKCKKAKEENLYDGEDVICAVGLNIKLEKLHRKKLGFDESRNTCYGDRGAPVFITDEKGYPKCLLGVVNGGMSFPDKGDRKARDRCYGGTTITTLRNSQSQPIGYFSQYKRFAKQKNKATVQKKFKQF